VNNMAKKEKPEEWRSHEKEQLISPLLAQLAEKTSELMKLEHKLLNKAKEDVIRSHENLSKKDLNGH